MENVVAITLVALESFDNHKKYLANYIVRYHFYDFFNGLLDQQKR